MTMSAKIQQKTGENWNDVKLALSNAVPVPCVDLPDLKSWYLQMHVPTPMAVDRVMVGGAKPAAASSEAVLDESESLEDLLEDFEIPPEAEFVQAVEKELPLAFEYELPQAVSLSSGGDETLLPLRTQALDGDFFVHAVPRKDPLAYLVCRTAGDHTLLAGRLNIHFGGRFISGSNLQEKKAGEDLLINLGVERGVKVQREKLTDKFTETFFGIVDRASTAREFEYRIVVENLKKDSVRVQILDAIPVSRTDRIQVKGVEITPEPASTNYQDREGVMHWNLHPAHQDALEIRVKFFVKYPKNNPPHGL